MGGTRGKGNMFINPNENFFEDLKNRDMKSQREAIKRYV